MRPAMRGIPSSSENSPSRSMKRSAIGPLTGASSFRLAERLPGRGAPRVAAGRAVGGVPRVVARFDESVNASPVGLAFSMY